MLKDVFVEIVETPYTKKMLICALEEKKDWKTLMIKFLKDNILPSYSNEAKKVVKWFSRYALDESDGLYQRSFLQPLLKCLGPEDAQYALMEVHDEICGIHIGAKSLTR